MRVVGLDLRGASDRGDSRPRSVDGGYVHAGPPGAGHFLKLVHSGIEFGMLQAIARERREGRVGERVGA